MPVRIDPMDLSELDPSAGPVQAQKPACSTRNATPDSNMGLSSYLLDALPNDVFRKVPRSVYPMTRMASHFKRLRMSGVTAEECRAMVDMFIDLHADKWRVEAPWGLFQFKAGFLLQRVRERGCSRVLWGQEEMPNTQRELW